MNKKFKKRGNNATEETKVETRTIVAKKNEKGQIGLVVEETGEVVFPYGNYTGSRHSMKSSSLILLSKLDSKLNPEFIGIYNEKRNRVLAKHWKVLNQLINPGYYVLWLENPDTGKIHLFNEETYGTKYDIFDKGYSNIEFLGDYIRTYPFALTNDSGKQALYINEEGFITDFEYDNIKDVIRIIILTKNNKKTFILAYDKSRNQSKEYDDIKCDGKYIYCKNGKEWDVYLEEHSTAELAFTTTCDDIKQLGEVENTNRSRSVVKTVFLQKKDGKYGLLEGIVDDVFIEKTTTRTLVGMEYDKITLLPRTTDGAIICKLVKGNEVGLFGYDTAASLFDEDYENKTEVKYNRIDKVYGKKIFALYTGDKCDIYNIKSGEKLIVGVENFEVIGDHIIYEKMNKKGIYRIIDNGFNVFGYDDIISVGDDLFMVDLKGKKGLLHSPEYRGIDKIIEPCYKSITIGHTDTRTPGYAETLYLSLETDQGDYMLNILDLTDKSQSRDALTKPEDNIYKQIKFYEHFFVTKNSRGVYVNSYDGNTVKVFEPGTEVFMDKIDTKDGRKLDLLIVNGVYYVLFKGEFILVDSENIPEYKYSYTSEYGEVGVVFHSKSEYDYFIKSTRKLSQEKMDDIFVGLYRESPKAQSNYPELKKTIGKRN